MIKDRLQDLIDHVRKTINYEEKQLEQRKKYLETLLKLQAEEQNEKNQKPPG